MVTIKLAKEKIQIAKCAIRQFFNKIQLRNPKTSNKD